MADRGKKRLLSEDDALTAAPPSSERKVRFPKGKKQKRASDVSNTGFDGDVAGDVPGWMDPQLATKERKRLRNKQREEEVLGIHHDVAAAEFHYEDNTNFEDEGIQIEPFNLRQEREEGYFDNDGNFVEYARKNEIKDAWLDSVEVITKFVEEVTETATEEEVIEDLSSEEIGKIKRNIANVLEPGETIKQALKRLKATSTDKRGKMSEVTKRIFDQLTDDAMRLMENGEYTVYDEPRETFLREAEGYERLARLKEDPDSYGHIGASSSVHGEGISSDGVQLGGQESSIWDLPSGPSAVNVSVPQALSNDDESFDMFGDDEDNADENLQSAPIAAASDSAVRQVDHPTSSSLDLSQGLDRGEVANGDQESDYVYDESSGYYYSSSLGYYYDPASGMYASASTGTWYIFDQESGTYKEVQNEQPL